MSAFTPNADYLQILTSMGYSAELATRALELTGNSSADLAAAWILDSQGEDVEPGSDDFLDESDFYKMIFVVNTDLKMGTGKLAAQVGHATLGLYRELIEDQQKYGEWLLQWEQFGETKIVLKGNNTAHLVELASKATSLGLPHYIVEDAGRTQIPEGSLTVLGLMGKANIVDEVTGSLSLLN